eukprot:scaffold20605_cov110-Skeletonema_dohrnii-CCMP3373.AAC.6
MSAESVLNVGFRFAAVDFTFEAWCWSPHGGNSMRVLVVLRRFSEVVGYVEGVTLRHLIPPPRHH